MNYEQFSEPTSERVARKCPQCGSPNYVAKLMGYSGVNRNGVRCLGPKNYLTVRSDELKEYFAGIQGCGWTGEAWQMEATGAQREKAEREAYAEYIRGLTPPKPRDN